MSMIMTIAFHVDVRIIPELFHEDTITTRLIVSSLRFRNISCGDYIALTNEVKVEILSINNFNDTADNFYIDAKTKIDITNKSKIHQHAETWNDIESRLSDFRFASEFLDTIREVYENQKSPQQYNHNIGMLVQGEEGNGKTTFLKAWASRGRATYIDCNSTELKRFVKSFLFCIFPFIHQTILVP